MLKAVLFDLDETLIDWRGVTDVWAEVERPHVVNVYHMLEKAGHKLPSADRFVDEYTRRARNEWSSARTSLVAPHVGRLLADTAIALGVPDTAVDMQACVDAYAETWGTIRGARLFPDVKDGLRLLLDRGIKLGIVTNSFHPITLRDQEISKFGLQEFFPDCRITAADAGYLKPHKNIFLEALKCLNVDVDEAIFIGDNPVADIAGAQAAGLRAILRVKQPPVPIISGLIVPDAAINTLEELPAILDEWFGEGWGNPA